MRLMEGMIIIYGTTMMMSSSNDKSLDTLRVLADQNRAHYISSGHTRLIKCLERPSDKTGWLRKHTCPSREGGRTLRSTLQPLQKVCKLFYYIQLFPDLKRRPSRYQMSPHGALTSAYTPLMPSSRVCWLSVNWDLTPACTRASEAPSKNMHAPTFRRSRTRQVLAFAMVIKCLVNNSLVELACAPTGTLSTLVLQSTRPCSFCEQAMHQRMVLAPYLLGWDWKNNVCFGEYPHHPY